MDNLEEKLGSILNNPDMMRQIMSMAQSFSQPQQESQQPKQESIISMPDLDPMKLQQMMSLVGQTGIDSEQRTLLKALAPYLTGQRIQKLERAMKAAKLANLATSLLGSGALQF